MTTVNNMVTVNNAQKLVKQIRIRCAKVGLMPSILGVRVADNAKLLNGIEAGICTILPEEFNRFCKALKLNKGSEDYNIFVNIIRASYDAYDEAETLRNDFDEVLGIKKDLSKHKIVLEESPVITTESAPEEQEEQKDTSTETEEVVETVDNADEVEEKTTDTSPSIECNDVAFYRKKLHEYIKNWCIDNDEKMTDLSLIISNSTTKNAFSGITSNTGNFDFHYIKNLFDIMNLDYRSGKGAELFEIIKKAYKPRSMNTIPQFIDESVFTDSYIFELPVKPVKAKVDTPSETAKVVEEKPEKVIPPANPVVEKPVISNVIDTKDGDITEEVKEARKAFGEKLGFYCFRKGLNVSSFSEMVALDEKELKEILNGNTNTPSEFHMLNIAKLLELSSSEKTELMELDTKGRIELSELPKYYEKYIRKAEIIETLGILAEANIDSFEVAKTLKPLVLEAKKKLTR